MWICQIHFDESFWFSNHCAQAPSDDCCTWSRMNLLLWCGPAWEAHGGKLVWGSEDTHSHRASWPPTGQVWEATHPIKYEGSAPSEQGVATPTAGKEDAISSAVCSPGPLTSPLLTVAVPFLSRGWTHSLTPLMVTKNHCLAPFQLNFSKSVPLPNILHHFTRPFLKLFLLNFYDSSHFYSA